MSASTSTQHGSNDGQLLTSLKATFNKLFEDVPSVSLNSSIYRVPERVRSVKKEAYTPMIVSIGPFHHGKGKDLKLMDGYKVGNIDHIVQRDQGKLEDLLKVMMESEVQARKCYAETILLESEELIKIMLLDGCFIVELFRQYERPRSPNHQIFSNHWISNAVYRDLLLLENQLPFFLLEKLFTIIDGFDQNHMMPELTFLILTRKYLVSYATIHDYIPRALKTGEHLVDLLLNNICNPFNLTALSPKGIEPAFIPSATELHESGIILGKNSAQKHLLDVTFMGQDLSIPPLHVDGRTESLFRNLLAMEQSHCGKTHANISNVTVFSDYLTLLDCLINTPADVALLQDRRIIHNGLGDNKEVAQLFNNIRNGVDRSPNGFFYYKLFQNVNIHYKNRWSTWCAKLKKDYLSTPWKVLSITAGLVLILCTIIQTVCSVLQVKQGSSSK